MKSKIVVLDHSPTIFDYSAAPMTPLVLGGKIFSEVPADYEDVFYDFVIGPGYDIRALQLQIDRSHPISTRLDLGSPGARWDHIDFSPCLRIWLSPIREGREVGLEAFGDLLILEAEDGTPAISFPTSWVEKGTFWLLTGGLARQHSLRRPLPRKP